MIAGIPGRAQRLESCTERRSRAVDGDEFAHVPQDIGAVGIEALRLPHRAERARTAGVRPRACRPLAIRRRLAPAGPRSLSHLEKCAAPSCHGVTPSRLVRKEAATMRARFVHPPFATQLPHPGIDQGQTGSPLLPTLQEVVRVVGNLRACRRAAGDSHATGSAADRGPTAARRSRAKRAAARTRPRYRPRPAPARWR